MSNSCDECNSIINVLTLCTYCACEHSCEEHAEGYIVFLCCGRTVGVNEDVCPICKEGSKSDVGDWFLQKELDK